MKNLKKSRVRGFTLIELLVVIAIIAILAAILFPVFAKVREKARQTSCASNEKQLGLGILQYIEDYDEQFPVGFVNGTPSNATNAGEGWAGQIYPYIKSTAVYKCPDDSQTNGVGTYEVSYVYNENLAFYYTGGTDTAGIKQAALSSPTQTVALFEGTNNLAAVTNPNEGTSASSVIGGGDYNISDTSDNTVYETGYLGGCGASGPAWMSGSYAGPTGWHTDGSNYLLADGHVKWMRSSVISIGFDAQAETADQVGCAGGERAAGTGFSGTSAVTHGPIAATFSII